MPPVCKNAVLGEYAEDVLSAHVTCASGECEACGAARNMCGTCLVRCCEAHGAAHASCGETGLTAAPQRSVSNDKDASVAAAGLSETRAGYTCEKHVGCELVAFDVSNLCVYCRECVAEESMGESSGSMCDMASIPVACVRRMRSSLRGRVFEYGGVSLAAEGMTARAMAAKAALAVSTEEACAAFTRDCEEWFRSFSVAFESHKASVLAAARASCKARQKALDAQLDDAMVTSSQLRAYMGLMQDAIECGGDAAGARVAAVYSRVGGGDRLVASGRGKFSQTAASEYMEISADFTSVEGVLFAKVGVLQEVCVCVCSWSAWCVIVLALNV